jgi:DNA-binding response OmpR family regulator
MVDMKPHVVYFSDEQEMVDLIKVTLSANFEVTPVIGLSSLEDALETLRVLKPDFVIVDPNLPSLDHQQLHQRMQADADLEGVQILIVSDDA